MAVITGTRALVILLQQTALLLTPIDAWQSVPTLPCRTRGSTLFSSRVCPNTTAECVCSTLAQGIAINWSLPAGNCPSNSILLSQSAETDCGMKHDACGAFEATNQIPPAGQPCTTSVLSVMASPTLSGAAVMCFSITSTQTFLNGAATILLLELPDPPVVSVIPSLDGETLVVNCSHAVTGGTPDSYVIKMTSTTTKTVAAINGDVIATFSQLTQNTTYSIRVTAANCAGHSGETEVNATTATIEQVIPPSDNGQASSNVVSIAAAVSVCAVAAMAVVLMCATVVLVRRHWKRHTKNLLERRSASEQYTAYCIESGVHNLVMEYPPGDDRMPVVMCNVKSNPPIARQQWYIVNQTGGRCLIRSKVDGKVLTCKDNTVIVCDIHNDDNTQLWRWDMNGHIFSVSSGQMVGVLKANKQLSLYEWGDKVLEETLTTFKCVKVIQ